MFFGVKDKLSKFFRKREEKENDNKSNLTLSKSYTKNKEENNKGIINKLKTKITTKEILEDDFEDLWLDLEIFLFDIGVAYEITEHIRINLKDEIIGKRLSRIDINKKIHEILKDKTLDVVSKRETDLFEEIYEIKKRNGLVKILVLGVNGAGKTTTISKLAKNLKDEKFGVVVSASDTFRAAAIEQLEEHCSKIGVKVVKQQMGSDPTAVAYDTINHAKSKNQDIVLIDTSGRQTNNQNLLNEIEKIKRVIKPDLTIFIGDSSSGNDIVEQIENFNKVAPIDGIILTKVDVDEKPGSIISCAHSIEKPIYFLGTGQEYHHLVKFDSKEITKKLFDL